MGFVVMSGSSLVFDMPKTKFGPNGDVSTVESWSSWLCYILQTEFRQLSNYSVDLVTFISWARNIG